jgi:ribonuclease P protein component
MLKPDILRKNSDFQKLYTKGTKTGDKNILVFFRTNGLDFNRRAFLASKKVGNSAQRNRARRLMKESWRLLSPEITEVGKDVVFIAKVSILDAKQPEVEASMLKALKKGKFLRT